MAFSLLDVLDSDGRFNVWRFCRYESIHDAVEVTIETMRLLVGGRLRPAFSDWSWFFLDGRKAAVYLKCIVKCGRRELERRFAGSVQLLIMPVAKFVVNGHWVLSIGSSRGIRATSLLYPLADWAMTSLFSSVSLLINFPKRFFSILIALGLTVMPKWMNLLWPLIEKRVPLPFRISCHLL